MEQLEPASSARIGIVASEPLQRAGLLDLLEKSTHFSVVTNRSDYLLQDYSITHLLVDIEGNKKPLSTIESYYNRRPDIRYILLGGENEERMITAALFLGVRGYLPRLATPERIVKMVEMVVGGSIWLPRRVLADFIEHLLSQLKAPKKSKVSILTERERQILPLLASAWNNREIASHLGIHERTVKAHITRLMEKTGYNNRLGLTMYAAAHTVSFEE